MESQFWDIFFFKPFSISSFLFSIDYILLFTVEGHSIYVRNLPFNVTVSELEAAFKKFGPIKKGGIQVRSHKVGFTEDVYIHVFILYTGFSQFCF